MERKLTGHERALSSQNVACIAVLQRPAAISSLDITMADATAACARLAKRHPNLRRVHGFSASASQQFLVDGSCRFNPADHVKIERLHPDDLEGKDKDILTTNATAHWQATLFKALGRIDLVAGSERPPWFVLLLVSDRVLVSIVIYNHVICDGVGGGILSKDFLTYLENGSKSARLDAEGPLPVPPALSSVIGTGLLNRMLASVGAYLGHYEILGKLIEPVWMFMPNIFATRYGNPKDEGAVVPINASPKMQKRTEYRRGSLAGSTRLFAQCKLHGCTVGGFVMASLMFVGGAVRPAAVQVEGTGGGDAGRGVMPDSESVGVSYDINWRSRLNPPLLNAVSTLISFDVVEHNLQRKSQGFWETAKMSSKMMKDNLEGGGSSKSALYYDMLEKMFEVGGAMRERQDKCSISTSADINYSNCGRWNHETDYGKLGQVQDIWMSESAPVGRCNVIGILFTTCVNGKMNFSIAYSPHILTDKYGVFLVDHVKDFCEGNVFDLNAPEDFTFEEYFEQHGNAVQSALPDAVVSHLNL